jgi:zinc protease
MALLWPQVAAIVRAEQSHVLKASLLSMKLLRFAFAPALSLALLVGPSLNPGASKAHAQVSKPVAAQIRANDLSHWPQDFTDVRPDPLIRFGRLPNGMRYALMHNATPSGQASFRLRFAVGSLMETDAQQGLAHFLEHMAFDGSNHVPTGEMIKILERHGLAFGADTNASTDWTETTYQLDLPKTDDDTVDTSMMLLREVGSELLIPQPAMDKERGVVLSEERLRDTPSYRAYKTGLEFMLPGQLASHRLPIGKAPVIQNAMHADIADIYQKYYRPERATFIAVGDFDLDRMEAKIKARFGDWHNSHAVGPEPDLGTPARRGLQASVTVEPGVQTSVQVAWVSPPDLSPDSRAKRRSDMIDNLGLAVLNRRLERITRSDAPPFLNAGSSRGNAVRSARVTSLQITARGGDWKPALISAVREQRRLVRYGVLQSEIDREIEETRASLKAGAAAMATRRTPNLANAIVGSLDDSDVVTDPAQNLALFEDIVKGLKADEVTAAARKAFQGQGPLIVLTSPKPIDGGEAAVTATFQAAQADPIAAPTAVANAAWPYEHFGAPGKVAERREAADVGATFVRFANGVRLTVKPTTFRKDQILVQVRVGDGRLDLPKDRPTASWARSAFIEGGLKKVTAEQLDQIMTSKIVGASFDLDDDAFVLSGSTKPSDLPTQLQVLTAYLTEPGLRPEAFERMRTYAMTLHDQLEATPNGVVSEQLASLMRSGDPRWSIPSREVIAASKPSDLAAMVVEPLARGAVVVIVVGDVTVDQAIAATADTLGSLDRPAPLVPAADERKIAFPAPTVQPVVRRHKGRADQAIAIAAWPTTDIFADPRGARTIRVMVEVMKLRMIDELRIAQGATYSPGATLEAAEDYPGFGYVSASVEIPPDKIAGFYDTVGKIAADLRTTDVTPDELKRATLPRIEALGKALQTNEFWLGSLAGGQTDPRRLELIGSQIPQLQSITAADVRKAAQTWLQPGKEWKFEVLPASAQ